MTSLGDISIHTTNCLHELGSSHARLCAAWLPREYNNNNIIISTTDKSGKKKFCIFCLNISENCEYMKLKLGTIL